MREEENMTWDDMGSARHTVNAKEVTEGTVIRHLGMTHYGEQDIW